MGIVGQDLTKLLGGHHLIITVDAFEKKDVLVWQRTYNESSRLSDDYFIRCKLSRVLFKVLRDKM